jgi:hypothetical protein
MRFESAQQSHVLKTRVGQGKKEKAKKGLLSGHGSDRCLRTGTAFAKAALAKHDFCGLFSKTG